MSAIPASVSRTRPTAVIAAVVLSVLVIIGNFASPLLPSGSGEDTVPTFVIVVGIILGLIGIIAVVGLWMLRKWGMILTIVVSAINVLLAAPGIAFGPDAFTKIIAGVFTLISALIIVLTVLPEARRAYH